MDTDVQGLHGQGKYASTILMEDGCVYPVISSLSHNDRTQSREAPYFKGSRPMHKTTFEIAKPAFVPQNAYKSTSNQYFSGSKSLNPVRRPPLCPSMHRSQWQIGQGNKMDCTSSYHKTFYAKEVIPRERIDQAALRDANRLHLASFEQKIGQTEGSDVKNSIQMDSRYPTYWSQYNLVQGKLGQILGPGQPRELPVRQKYNVLTGENCGPAWSPENKRISGNRVLFGHRREQTYNIIS